jgi:DNA-binding NarL/FixJ family response regulator
VQVVRVLLVDDQPEVLRVLAAIVDECPGFAVVAEATSGEAALVAAAETQPDLVLMDVNLPGIDGVEATRRLLRGNVPPAVILLSTYDDDAGERLVAESGAGRYLTKSVFGPECLADAWAAVAR